VAGAERGVSPQAIGSTDAASAALASRGYLADRPLALAVYLAVALGQPLLLEGEAGVGKTEVARALAPATGARLIRLQCHEGIDVHHALYDWDYSRQLLALRAAEGGLDEGELFSRRFLLRRPLLEALEAGPEQAVVVLIDEIDRADDEFEAFLLELLSDFQVTIPELGTIAAARPPVVILTSNRTRELHDALKRRCLYHWIDYPGPEREREIVRVRIPGVPEQIATRVVEAVGRLREQRDLYKLPGVGETIVWARALLALDSTAPLEETLGAVLKVHEDLIRVRERGVLEGV
jgi:MoxR-like ATPase